MEKSYDKRNYIRNSNDLVYSTFSRYCDVRKYDIGHPINLESSQEFIEDKLLGVVCLAFIMLYTVIMFSL